MIFQIRYERRIAPFFEINPASLTTSQQPLLPRPPHSADDPVMLDFQAGRSAKCAAHIVQAALPPSQWQQGHMLDWMLRPSSTEHFVKHHLDRRPLHIGRRKHPTYFDGLLTKSDIHQLLKTQQLQYGTNVDVTSYTGGKRRNLNHNGKESTGEPEVASAATVMQRFEREGCSVRILHPQRWVEPIYKLLSFLEDELRSPVGCNAYLTPPSSQGFAPHWDDIDAFVLQVEVHMPLMIPNAHVLHCVIRFGCQDADVAHTIHATINVCWNALAICLPL